MWEPALHRSRREFLRAAAGMLTAPAAARLLFGCAADSAEPESPDMPEAIRGLARLTDTSFIAEHGGRYPAWISRTTTMPSTRSRA